MTPTSGVNGGTFLETFDGSPSAPTTYSNPNSWDINPGGVNTSENGTYAQLAHHGPMCQAPGIPYTSTNAHPLAQVGDMIFQCNDHLMTSTGLTGYGAIYMVPPATADITAGTSVISWDMSTLRTGARDWVYITLMPYEGHNKFGYNNLDQAIPPNNVNVVLAGGGNVFIATQRTNGGSDVRLAGNSYYTWDNVQSANGVAPSASRRDSFRIELSATHLRVCITGNNTGQVYNFRGQSPYCFVDSDMTSIASWGGQAVVMITHVSYNVEKSCSTVEDQFHLVHNPTGDANCPPNTWHWDNVRISPARAFTVINPQQQFPVFSDPGGTNTVTFAQPAPAGAKLSYIATGDCASQRFSVNGGQTWITAIPQPSTTQCAHPENGGEYWTLIPEGTTSVKFTGSPVFGHWEVSDPAIWATTALAPTPTPIPTPTPTASPTPTPSPTATPSPTPSPTATATATPSTTPQPTASPSPSPTPVPTTAVYRCQIRNADGSFTTVWTAAGGACP